MSQVEPSPLIDDDPEFRLNLRTGRQIANVSAGLIGFGLLLALASIALHFSPLTGIVPITLGADGVLVAVAQLGLMAHQTTLAERQLTLATDQAKTVKRQTAILQRQDALLERRAALRVFLRHADVKLSAVDESCSVPNTARSYHCKEPYVLNEGTRGANRFSISIRMTAGPELTDSSKAHWTSYRDGDSVTFLHQSVLAVFPSSAVVVPPIAIVQAAQGTTGSLDDSYVQIAYDDGVSEWHKANPYETMPEPTRSRVLRDRNSLGARAQERAPEAHPQSAAYE